MSENSNRTHQPVLLLFLTLCVSLVSGCGSDDSSSDALFQLLSPRKTGIDFANTIVEERDTYNMIDFYYIYNGAGVALGDINNDGLVDIYLTGNRVSSRLYLNKGNLEFDDITEAAGVGTEGWTTGAVFNDVNADGYLDLYVSRAGPVPPQERTNYFFINDGDLTFSDKAASLGVADTSFSTQAAFFDYDKDGDLDLFLLNHSNEDSPNLARRMLNDGSGIANDRLYRQEADGHFTDVTLQAGILKAGLSLGVGINDLDGDGWEDVYVSNDFMVHDHLYMNERDGSFTEQGTVLMKHHSFASMGHDIADINNDGLVDVFVLDMRPPDNEQQKRQAFPMTETNFPMTLQAGYHPQYWRNVLQLNEGLDVAGNPVFSDIGQYAGVDATGWSWGPLFADFDNDGWRDLMINNGYRRAVIDWDFINSYVDLQMEKGVEPAKNEIKDMAAKMYDIARADYLFRNRGDLQFEDVSSEWGFDDPSFSNGAAFGDLDNDGDLDIVVNRINDPAAIYENRSVDPNYLRVKLTGGGKNLRGIGSDLYLYCGTQVQYHHHSVTRGYQSAVDEVIHFGLGACATADSLRIVWPDGTSQLIRRIPGKQLIELNQAEASEYARPAPVKPVPMLSEVSRELGASYQHVEEPFNDFERQRLKPHKHSHQGPGIAAGDVNGDGLDDFFVAGAYRHHGSLFTQRADGSFSETVIDASPRKYEEDLGVLLFDADGDNDNDLYIVSGSSEYIHGSEYLQDRLYINSGTGSFTRSSGLLPDMSTSSSCVTAADYDQDGDLDLFVCGRVQPIQYPLAGRSYILRNDGGTFVDVTDDIGGGVRDAGMISAALWSDFNQDGRFDLVLVGEFTPVLFFENSVDGFRNVTDQTGLAADSGWWNSLSGADFDNDGDIDYVLGNLGLNSKFRASEEEPISIYGGDFDYNGHIDPILTQYLQGEEYPVASYEDFTTQLPEQKLYYPTVEKYSRTPFADLFPPERIETAPVLRATRFENSYVENLGGGRFSITALPARAQLGPVFGLQATDVDEDGYVDILAVGNSYAPDVVTGRYDALNGLFLRGNGAGEFESVPFQKSGFFVPGDGKGLAGLVGAGGNRLVAATQNNGPLQVFASRKGETFIPLEAMDAVAVFTLDDQSVRRHELYYGSGYLSQSSRQLVVPPEADFVTLTRFDGTERTIQIDRE